MPAQDTKLAIRSFFDIRLRLHDSLAERGSHYLVHRGIYPYNLCLVPCVLFVLSMNVLTIGKESSGQWLAIGGLDKPEDIV
jgi:hypothetical protein